MFRIVRQGLAVLIVLCGVSAARSQRLPLPGPLQAQVNHAIDRGMVFLAMTQGLWGTWTLDPKNHSVGYAALPGLTLLECGERPEHPSILLAADFVRKNALKLDSTYDLSLAILFLDRLGDSKDEKLLETLALRLIAGQSLSGGWSYRCPILAPQLSQRLLTALAPKSKTFSSPPATLLNLPVFNPSSGFVLAEPQDKTHEVRGTTDNSNSQFAALALWAARRHGMPMNRSLTLIARRFMTSQNPDGSWGYRYSYGGGDPERPAMTCVGLLGLAIGHGLAADKEAAENPALVLDRARAAALVAFHPPSSFVFLALDRAEKKQALGRAQQRANDVQVLNGFLALDKHVGEPVDRTADIPQKDLYFMWSLERVGVLYDLPTIGRKNWYRWGAEMLVANQKFQGNWDNGGYPSANPIIDTCLALLFLKRGNLVADLTTKLPFDPNALTKSINEQLAPGDSATSNTLKTVETSPAAISEPPVNHAKGSTPSAVALVPQTAATPVPAETETRGKSGWLWLLVLLAVLLFIACGVLLTSYSLAQKKPSNPAKWKRQPKHRPRGPHRVVKGRRT
jgi:hypothetical protein